MASPIPFGSTSSARAVFTTLTSSAARYESFLLATGPAVPGGGWSTDEDAAAVAAVAGAAGISVFGPPGMLPAEAEHAHAA